jgi:GTP diphosphokinase / guanosine-3',5'-bis(diphosphate) 3'-diphosphatase
MNSMEMVFKALELAAVRHRKQYRKGGDRTPYINHLVQVVNILASEGGETDIVLLSAAALHDVLEDTIKNDAEMQQVKAHITEVYGAEVLSVVLEVTDDKSLDKKEVRRLQVEHAPHMTQRAQKLKLADKLANIRDIAVNPPFFWPRKQIVAYIEWSKEVIDKLRGVHPVLETAFDKAYHEALEKHSGKRFIS